MKIETTTRAFLRSHGKEPKGRGSWAFQAATNWTAFDRELVGELKFYYGTLTEAKKQAIADG